MSLKATIDKILKERARSLTWLADSMGKTFDGLKLSLVNGSIKYKDILTMAEILEVSPSAFFTAYHPVNISEELLSEPKPDYGDLKSTLKVSRELIVTLKEQIKDKDRIISLLDKRQ